jgi:cytidylate kinase
MALIAVSGHPGCRFEEVARITAQHLRFDLLTESRIQQLASEEFGAQTSIPDKVYASLVTSLLANVATAHHIVYCAVGGEEIARHFPGMLRVHLVAPENVRIGNLMLDQRLDRPAARQMLQDLEKSERALRKAKFGKSKPAADRFDMVLSAEFLTPEQIAGLIEAAVQSLGLQERGFLSASAEAQLQFQMRLRLAKHGLVPPDKITLRKKIFANQSEEIFANLLDFYRIAWEYEPRSFPVAYDADGNPTEFFTPDFYLPEFDQFVELTTMKQALVTRKNRKIRLLREQYPEVNIQVYYQKDFENLVFKHGLAERPVEV